MNLLARFHLYTLDTDAVARALCADLFRDYDANELEPQTTRQFIRTRYMRLVASYGLPAGAVDAVAARAWAIVAQARTAPIRPEQAFAFFE
jgi:hypothetical protein